MRHFLLVLVFALLACTNAVLASTGVKSSSKLTRPTSVSTRLLRVVSPTDADDDSDDEYTTEARAINPIVLDESIAKGTSTVNAKVSAAKMSAKLSDAAANPIKSFRRKMNIDHLDDAMLIKSKKFKKYDEFVTSQVRVWAEKGLTLDEVKVLLGIEKLSGSALWSSPNFKYFEMFVEMQIPVLVKKGFLPNDMWVTLGLNKVAGNILETRGYKLYAKFMNFAVKDWAATGKSIKDVKKFLNIDDATMTMSLNFKFYDEFVISQIPVWSKQDLSLQQLKVLLGIEKLEDYALKSNPHFEYINMYVKKQIPIWVEKDVPTLNVWAKLGLDDVPWIPLYLKKSPGYAFYEKFMNRVLENWAMNMLSKEEAASKLGLNLLKKKGLKGHPNFAWFTKFAKNADSYRVEGWYKQKLTSYDVWKKVGLGAIRPGIRADSEQYKIYESYAQKLDDVIERSLAPGYPVANVFGKLATETEISTRIKIWVDTGKDTKFVKYALGMSKLDGKKLKRHKYYKYLREFENRRKGRTN